MKYIIGGWRKKDQEKENEDIMLFGIIANQQQNIYIIESNKMKKKIKKHKIVQNNYWHIYCYVIKSHNTQPLVSFLASRNGKHQYTD